MEMEEHLTNTILVMIIVLICLIVFIFIIKPILFGGDDYLSVRKMVCGGLFYIPFGSIFTTLTHGCAIIPA